ncbi:MAG: hypothetical protein C0484_15005 [Rhodospirillum sp.]|nr:hypothetical protein [Rhodospirillum sp.]
MEIPFSELASLEGVDYCIIGSGPAGITCARELAAKNRKVLLLEGGGREWSEESQSLYEGETLGDTYYDLQDARLRYFGGTSNHWAGWCRPLDAHEFEGKGPTAIGRWPIRRKDLDEYFPRAGEILEIELPEPDTVLPGGMLRRISYSFSPPARFGEKYQSEIIASDRIILALNCNLTRMNAAGSAILSITVQDYGGGSVEVKARDFILACGGIENSRLLLWSNLASGGVLLKEQAKLVGRYWFEHHHAEIGDAIVETGFIQPPDNPGPGAKGIMLLSLTPKMVAEKGILSCSLRLNPSPRSGVKALIEDIACVAPTWASWADGEAEKGQLCAHRLKATAEQEPRFENRVELGDATDRFGIPKVRLHWRHSELDLRTFRESAKALGVYLAVEDIGRVRLLPWLVGEAEYPQEKPHAAYHHMGGTRMADDAGSGVVDRNCLVFGLSNLHVIGSSVFPGGGHSTPTVTIVQLALRLSDHLAARS